MIERRTFLKNAVLGGIGAVMLPQVLKAEGLHNFSTSRKEDVGIQLYSIKETMAKDVEKTLAQVAKIGYKKVELAGYYNMDAKKFKAALDKAGLKAPSTHIAKDRVEKEIDKVIEEAGILGHEYIIVPWMEPKTADDYKAAAQVFNKAGEACKKAGFKFGYHNHAFEFDKFDGVTGYEILLNETDKSLVEFELDLFWVAKAKGDIIAMFEKYPGRFPMWHVKDMAKNLEENNTEIGSGQLNWPKIFANAEKSGMKHFFVEQENYEMDQMKSIAISHEYLKNLK